MQARLKANYPDADARKTLRDIVADSRDKVQIVRTRLEASKGTASLGVEWKESERLVEAEAGRVARSFRSLRDDPAMRPLVDIADEADTEWTFVERFTIDALRLQPIVFCLEIEQYLRVILSTLS